MSDIQKRKISFVKDLYKKVNLEREFKPTKDGIGFYIHPKNDNFLKIKGKRIGLFIDATEPDNFTKRNLIEIDDEYRRKLGFEW